MDANGGNEAILRVLSLRLDALRRGIRRVERRWTYEPLLSQLARVSDISGPRIEIQNVELT